MDVLCNGAGEMPGHEGDGSYDSHYEPWIDAHEDWLIEKYRESIESIDDIPQAFIDKLYEDHEEYGDDRDE